MKRDSSAPGPCVLCGNAAVALLYELDGRSIVRCTACGTGRTVNRGDQSVSQERFDAERWLETRGMLGRFLRDEARWRYRHLAPFQPGRDLLEIGCGTGEFLAAASQAGHSVVGLDISAAAVQSLRERRPDFTVVCGFLHEAGFANERFDAVCAFHVLEHVEDLAGFLHEIRTLLRPGGLLYVRVPNLDSWYRRVLGRGWWGFMEEHVWHFTQSGLRQAMGAASFEVLECRSSGYEKHSLWPVLPFLFRQDRAMRRMSGLVAPRQGAAAGGSGRRAAKRVLLRAYLLYRRVASVPLLPLLALQNRTGGGTELCAVARKR